MQTQLQAVLDEIDGLGCAPVAAAPPAEEPATPAPGEDLEALLQRLDQALQTDIGAVEPLLIRVRAQVQGTACEQPFAAVAAAVEVFDIDSARTALSALSQQCCQ